jgi:prepilin-type N-terminal cleavage/methylation domain-containing protein
MAKYFSTHSNMINQNHSPTRSQAERHGFTLIELLVVISIIAVLAGLAFPAVNGAMDSVRKARAKSDVTQITMAVMAYDLTYTKLPTVSGNKVDSGLIGTLTGNNTYKTVFLETSPWKKGIGGTNASGEFCDPWDSNSVYQIALDTTESNSVTAGTNGMKILAKVAVWNDPSNHSNTSAAQKARRYVTSW